MTIHGFSNIPNDLSKVIVYNAFVYEGNFNLLAVCKNWSNFLDPLIAQCWSHFTTVSMRASLIEERHQSDTLPPNFKERFCELKEYAKREFSLNMGPVAPMIIPDQYFVYENDSLMKLWHTAIWPQISEFFQQLDNPIEWNNPNDVRNFLRSPDPTIRAKLNAIKDIKADGCELSVIPEEICCLPGVQRLVLSNNNIQIIPEFLGRLKNIQSLIMPGNKFVKFPDDFASWTHINELVIYNNENIKEEGNAQLDAWFANGKVERWAPKCYMREDVEIPSYIT